MAALYRRWREIFYGDEMSAAEIISDGRLGHELTEAGCRLATAATLGTWLGRRRDQVYGGLVLRRRHRSDGNRWRVVPVTPSDT